MFEGCAAIENEGCESTQRDRIEKEMGREIGPLKNKLGQRNWAKKFGPMEQEIEPQILGQ